MSRKDLRSTKKSPLADFEFLDKQEVNVKAVL